MLEGRIDPNMSMDIVMCRWPVTITVLIGYNMHCIGCALAPFHSISDAAWEHKVDESALLSELERAVAESLT